MELLPTDALLVIDMQNDFCPGGTLAVEDGDTIIPTINALGQRFEHVILTQDWHPERHISFASSHPGKQPYTVTEVAYGPQTLWPDHCLRGSSGAEFHVALDLPYAELIVRKGFRREIDSYSAFLENDHTTPTGLAGYLRERGLKRLFICGLAYDFCVRFSAIDGTALGFECLVVEDASKAVGLPGSVDATNQAFSDAGVARIDSQTILTAGPARGVTEKTESSHTFILRPHRIGDMGLIVQREGLGYAEQYGWDGSFEALVARIVSDFVANFDAAREYCWIAEVEGQHAGHIFLVRHPEEPGTAKLRLLFVERLARGMGLGEALVNESVGFARSVGYERIVLWTQSMLTAAHRIYAKAGFQLIKEEPHHSFGHDLVGQEWELKLK